MNLSFEGFYDWVKDEAKWILFTAVIVVLFVTGFKRQWIAMAGALVGFGVIGIFILNPDVIEDIGDFIGDKTDLGK